MTQEEIIAHWQKGAEDSLEMAELGHKAGKYSLALFHCQLAVEKSLKGAYIAEYDKVPPRTHDLVSLAEALGRKWKDEQRTLLETLTRFTIDARYADPTWAEEYATEEQSIKWIDHAKSFLLLLQP